MAGPGGAFRVALTFDAEHPDRPHCPPSNPERLLEQLEGAGVGATFFLQGRWVEAYPATARRVVRAGHLVGSHSHYHARMPLLSAEGLRADLAAAEEAITSIAGRNPRPWFRLPFGAGEDDPDLLRSIEGLGYRHVACDVDVRDWDPDRTPEEALRVAVDGAIAYGDDAVLMFHTWPATTALVLPEVIGRLADAGASFVTVAELPRRSTS
jgi:peptidoglycan-N-acetylglucosamine deacetylase